MELALAAGVSTRHLSFVETGRSRPGRELVLRLAEALDLPLRHVNSLLVAADYAPRYTAWSLDDDPTGMVRAALDRMLARHEPDPALVTTRDYDVIMTNEGARRLLSWLTDGDDLLTRHDNTYRMLFDADGLRPYLVDFERLQPALLKRLHEESMRYQSDTLLGLYEECAAHVSSGTPAETDPADDSIPVITLGLRKGHVELWFLSTVTTFGTAIDVTTEELRVECLFPADEATREFVESEIAG
ncbi:MAG TPA: helix-turn-helix transcriptional regulator [Candidatus Krumholzibacteria bacterium]|nr:helix-turn-helix transcriptional regulator [Candidatus Krumholzibacteria bacterium]